MSHGAAVRESRRRVSDRITCPTPGARNRPASAAGPGGRHLGGRRRGVGGLPAPTVFGAVAVALGGYAWRRGAPRGRWVILAAVVCTLFGLALTQLPDWLVSN